VHHESDQQTTDEDIRYNNYIEYGKRFMQLVKEVSEQE
jgi:hypothetical protein